MVYNNCGKNSFLLVLFNKDNMGNGCLKLVMNKTKKSNNNLQKQLLTNILNFYKSLTVFFTKIVSSVRIYNQYLMLC